MDYSNLKIYYQNVTVAEQYDRSRWNRIGRRLSNRRKLRCIRKAIDYAERLNGIPINNGLDLACVTGRIFPILFKKRINVVGADISAEMMRIAKERFTNINNLKGFIRCNAEYLPFKSDIFDTIFCIRFLFHLPSNIRVDINIRSNDL